jgi:hypothetical protein
LFFTLLGIFCHLHVVAADIGTQKVRTSRSTLHHTSTRFVVYYCGLSFGNILFVYLSQITQVPKKSPLGTLQRMNLL